MSARALTRAYAAAVAVLLVWPAAQFMLVTFYDANPWKLAGFAMYAIHHQVDVLVVDLSGPVQRDLRGALPRGADAELKRFERNRDALGELVSPERLGQAVLEEMPEVDEVGIEIMLRRLGPRSSTFSVERQQFRYARGGPR